MKKFVIGLLLFMLFIPFIKADNCDVNNISISSIEIDSKTDNVTELEEASVSGRNVNVNVNMTSVGDNIKYKMVVHNASNDDYSLSKNSFSISSDYVDYSIETEDNSNIVKGNSNKVVFLNVEFKNEVPEEAFQSGKFNDNKTVTMNLSTGNGVVNPKTGAKPYILIITIVLIVSCSVFVILRRKKYSKLMGLIIGVLVIIPISVYALCEVDISVESSVEISKNPMLCFNGKYIEYRADMTWEEFYQSSFFKNEDWIYDSYYEFPNSFRNNNNQLDWINREYFEHFNEIVPSGTIMSSEEGCYTIEPV